jgi:hypothetical protein
MNPLLIGPLFEFGKALLNRFIPDPEKQREAEMEMFKMAAEGEMKQILSQLEINAREALHPSVWVAGWRPFFGWVGGCGFLYATIIQPILVWYGTSRGWTMPPQVGTELLWVVVTGILGIGGLRTYEKKEGVSK